MKRILAHKIWGASPMAMLLSMALVSGAQGAAILSDAFDYPVGDLHGNAGGVGWADGNTPGAGAWGVFVDPGLTGAATVESGSLTLSTFPTSGNRLQLSATASDDFNSGKNVRPFRNVGVSVTSGELWQSFLWRRVDDAFNGDGDGIQDSIRINSAHGEPIHFRLRPKRQNLDGYQIRYNAHLDEVEEPAVSDGTTYLMVARYTNLGVADGAGTATLWILDASDYDAIGGGGTLASNNTSVSKVAAGSNNALTMQAGDNYRILHLYRDLAAFNGDPFITEWDEMRWGTSLGDVVPGWTSAQIPEPSSILLVLVGGLSLALVRQRQT